MQARRLWGRFRSIRLSPRLHAGSDAYPGTIFIRSGRRSLRHERLLRKMCDSYTLAWNPLHRLIGLFELSRVWNKRIIYGCVVQVGRGWNVSYHIAYSICNIKYWIWDVIYLLLICLTCARP